MKLKPVELVHIDFVHRKVQQPLGRLLLHKGQILFEYDPRFISSRLEVSPFHLPLKTGVQMGKPGLFEGLPGLFNDSLPDGWGKLLLDRAVSARGIPPQQLTPLDRLAHVGTHGMGALVYKPDFSEPTSVDFLNLDRLAEETQVVLEGKDSAILDQLVELGGSSAGARPKVLIGFSQKEQKIISGQQDLPAGYEHWLVKFSSASDQPDIARLEMAYSLMARTAGLSMTETRLFSGKKSKVYFGTKRFDRIGNQRVHVHSASGLLNADHRYPSLDYETLMRATLALCKDMRDVSQLFRLTAFNVFAHNRDDHSKNFSFLMGEIGQWSFSPAYDLTFSYGPGSEHCSMIMGEGRTPGTKHLENLGKKFQVPKAKEIIEQVKETVNRFPEFADQIGLKSRTKSLVQRKLQEVLKR